MSTPGLLAEALQPELGAQYSFLLVRWLYLRFLGLAYVLAFLSLLRQICGLIGPRGILPARDVLQGLEGRGARRYLAVPTLLWLGSGDRALRILCCAGLACGFALLMNVAPAAAALGCWVCYLSFVAVARDFSGFQSDGLLLESSMIGFLLAPGGMAPGFGENDPPWLVAVYLGRWLLFRLMFESGLAKLRSGDPGWRNLSAMYDYYENCPFPTWIGWWVQKLPRPFHAASAAFTLLVELLLPWGILAGDAARGLVFAAWTVMHAGIIVTANYTLLNYNSIALGLLLLDDRTLSWLLGESFATTGSGLWPDGWLSPAIAGAIVYLSLLHVCALLGGSSESLPGWLLKPYFRLQPLRSVNMYALFAVMTHGRKQIFFEGSRDGVTWQEYGFKWQPQALDRRPRFMAPHLPRFDWNLWFAGQERFRAYPLVSETARRILQGEPCVLALFARDPFEGEAPRFVRVPVYEYRFSGVGALFKEGKWWEREPCGYYCDVLEATRAGSG